MKNRLANIMSTLLILLILPLNLIIPQKAMASEGAASITITVTLVEAEIIEATVEFLPQTIRQTRRNIKCYIELPQAYTVENIEAGTIRLTEVNGIVLDTPLEADGTFKIGDYDKDGTPDLTIRFNIRNLILNVGENNLIVTGNMTDDNIFKGTGNLYLLQGYGYTKSKDADSKN